MRAIVVSDLHMGSRHFMYQEFECLLRSIPGSYEIILNGDVLDNPLKALMLPHRRILDILSRRSFEQRVVWVLGNHDNGYLPDDFGNVHIRRTYALEKRLLITHGYDFDEIMPRNQAFMKIFKILHNLRVKLGARPVHVAEYAKKWKVFYNVLTKNVKRNAVICAKENEFEAVTCGHTHYPDDVFHQGVRYINTGAWTEAPSYYLLVTDTEMTLKKMGNLQEVEGSFHGNDNGTEKAGGVSRDLKYSK